MARRGKARRGEARHGRGWATWRGEARFGVVGSGLARSGLVWRGEDRHGEARSNDRARLGRAGRGEVRCGRVWPGMARQGDFLRKLSLLSDAAVLREKQEAYTPGPGGSA